MKVGGRRERWDGGRERQGGRRGRTLLKVGERRGSEREKGWGSTDRKGEDEKVRARYY